MKINHRSGGTIMARGRDRVLVRVDVRATRVISALMMLCVLGWLTVLVVREHLGYERLAPGRFGWSVALLAAVALIARGIFLDRPVTARHAMNAAVVVSAGLCTHFFSLDLVGNILVAGSGLVLMMPTTAQPQPEMLERVWQLVDATRGDPVGAFCHAFEQKLSL